MHMQHGGAMHMQHARGGAMLMHMLHMYMLHMHSHARGGAMLMRRRGRWHVIVMRRRDLSRA